MSCPVGKPSSISDQHGSTGVPAVKPVIKKLKGMTWKPVSGPPKVGELYCLPERDDIGIADDVHEWEGMPSMGIHTQGSYYNATYDETWMERADRPEPQWSEPPVELPVARITVARYGIIGSKPLEQFPHCYRANLTNGDFIMIFDGEQTVACLFGRNGVRALGMAAAGGDVTSSMHQLELRLDQRMKVAEKRKSAHFDPQEGELLLQNFQGDFARLDVERRLAAGETLPTETMFAYPDLLARYGV